MFDVYAENFTIETKTGPQVISFQPLPGEYFGKLINLAKSFSDTDTTNNLSEETVRVLHQLVFVSLCQTYPQEDKKKLEMFVTQNLFKLIEPLMKVNLPQTK